VPAYSAQMVVIVRGALEIEHVGVSERPGTLAINAPQLRAAPCMLGGPALLIGASLTPLGWQALANLPADKVHDRLLAPDAILTGAQNAALVAAAAACAAGRVTPREVCAQMVAEIAAARFALRPDHVALVEAMTRWLGSGFDPPLADLHAAVPVSPRQLQWLSRRYFGARPGAGSQARAGDPCGHAARHPGTIRYPARRHDDGLFRSGPPDPRHPPLHRPHADPAAREDALDRAAQSERPWPFGEHPARGQADRTGVSTLAVEMRGRRS
jgi:hypothetical protein